MKLRKRLLAIFLLLGCVSAMQGQSKFHFDLDYHYYLGLSEKFMNRTFHRDTDKMGGNSLRFTARYDLSPLWSAGVGLGLDCYTNPSHNTMPIFATVRCKAIKTVPELYAFSDLGYAVKVGDYSKGFTGSLGIGYTYNFAKHLGVNFQIAYNLKCFDDLPTYTIDTYLNRTTYSEEDATRHSLSFGIGLTF